MLEGAEEQNLHLELEEITEQQEGSQCPAWKNHPPSIPFLKGDAPIPPLAEGWETFRM